MKRLIGTRSVREPFILLTDATLAALSLAAVLHICTAAGLAGTDSAWVLREIALAVAVRVVISYVFGLQRWSFRTAGLHEGIRLALATCIGTTALVGVGALIHLAPLSEPVVLLDYFFMTALAATYRFIPRWVLYWLSNLDRAQRDDSLRTIIVGAGPSGDLLLRDLLHNEEHHYHVIGFVDDAPTKFGTSLSGKPVLGNTAQLAHLVARHGVSKVLIADPRFPAERLRRLLSDCAQYKVSFKIIPASFSYLDDRISAALLHDLRPEDLLSRESIVFDRDEVRSLVAGRRILVTGAGGSIGSEISRQVAQHHPQRLVLVDMNENELYLLTRSLQEKHPGLEIHAIVADIRDADRMMELGNTYKPHDVFHGAAHKHVPLMEDAPAEAIKNNIFGTMNVAKMAHECGVERFVLISTDKAVAPSSVMGVSKRVAELIVRDFASRSKTRFTAVRFGNVLGSAGSVVPLFKQQIERGGPVTVTHRDCTRFFMTIPEAVGLVIIAGLGGYGDLCILDMGEAFRIADLAANMITMAGLIPGVDIDIEYTGLRPGEKLAEQLLTEDEESSRTVRNKILVCNSPAPPINLDEQLRQLREAALAQDRKLMMRGLRAIVPTYKPANVPGAPVPIESRQSGRHRTTSKPSLQLISESGSLE